MTEEMQRWGRDEWEGIFHLIIGGTTRKPIDPLHDATYEDILRKVLLERLASALRSKCIDFKE